MERVDKQSRFARTGQHGKITMSKLQADTRAEAVTLALKYMLASDR